MFNKVVVANRGAVAARVLRALYEMGIKSVAVYSEADYGAPYLEMASETYAIGASPATDSYLNQDTLLAVLKNAHADGVHPGYGFLSENAHFADVCESCNIRFIGPTSRAMKALEDKQTSRALAKKAGVPIPPGSEGLVENEQEALAVAKKIGYPVMIKAVAGGGGRGMRVVWEEKDLEQAFNSARQEAGAAFGNDGMYMEKFIEEPRHIEIQVVGDQYGKACHLSERDCSIQRRHQKLVEETPSPFMVPELRDAMGEAAVKAALAVNYEGCGTVEFLVDKHRNFYFMEMNTRIQVEHPITEEVIDYDLIREQILVAAGVPISGKNYYPQLHAMECRINAEDPFSGFRPSPGKITTLHTPGGHGIRFDSHVYAGYTIPSNYDSMIGKLISIAQTREEAISKMYRALSEYVIEGIKTTIPFHLKLMQNEEFRKGNYTTKFLETFDLTK